MINIARLEKTIKTTGAIEAYGEVSSRIHGLAEADGRSPDYLQALLDVNELLRVLVREAKP